MMGSHFSSPLVAYILVQQGASGHSPTVGHSRLPRLDCLEKKNYTLQAVLPLSLLCDHWLTHNHHAYAPTATPFVPLIQGRIGDKGE